jgi:PRTRC genetic system ThiF family protein
MPPRKTSNVITMPRRPRRARIALPPEPELDFSHLDAATVITRNYRTIRFVQAGAGGTGSFLAQGISRLAAVLEETGRRVKYVIIDPDRVEEGNVPRSNFSESEIGRYKAQTLALRFSRAWGVEITSVNMKFHPSLLWQSHEQNCLTVLVGAVDNPAARRSINLALKAARDTEGRTPDTWWIDCGNDRETGQVLIGSATTPEQLRGAFAINPLCQSLPSPAMQRPDLLRAVKEGPKRKRRLSCLQLMLMNEQSLMINQRIAIEAGEILTQLLLYRNLQRFATFVDTKLGVQTSEYTTPEAVARSIRMKQTDFLLDATVLEEEQFVAEEAA